MLNLTKCLSTAETFALIYWQALHVERQNALKCKEKIGLKLKLGNYAKTKVFVTSHLRYFLFKLL